MATSPSRPYTPISRTNAGTPTPLARNPVTVRLYKVLGAAFDDDATKDALTTLSELYAVAPPPSVKGKEVHRARDAEDDFETLLDGDRANEHDAEHSIPSFLKGPPPGETAARARKHLRRDIETKLAEGSQKFLNAFGEVDRKLDALQEHITAMRLRCDEAETQLQSTNDACRSLLDRAGSLREQRQDINRKQSIVNLFLERFTLDENEIEALTSGEVPVGSRFFAAMDKTQRIREDCRVLMAGEEKPSQAGLDIMASTSGHLEKGYDKLFRYSTFEFRQMGRDAQLDVSNTLTEAIRRLRQRPELLSEALSTLSQTRQSALVSAFQNALTRGHPRPIELHAHDALRYVGDMLAWIHQAVAAEREFLEALFAVQRPKRMVGAVRQQAKGDEEGWMAALMDGALAGVCAPLRGRVLQTVRAQERSGTAYKVANLLQFYAVTMGRTIGEQALLSTTLKEITDVSYKVFFDAIEAQGRALIRTTLDPSDASLTPPTPLLDHAQTLRDILALHATSEPTNDETVDAAADAAQVRRILDTMVDPAVEMCIAASEEKGRRAGWDRGVFVLNCLTYLVGVLEPYEFTKEKQEELGKLVEERVRDLTEEHYQTILHDTALYDVVQACENRQPSDILSHLPATQPSALTAALAHFATWLSGLEVVHAPRLALLQHAALNARIHRAALRRLAKAYARVCEEVRRPENRYEAPGTLLGGERPFGRVGVLEQILGVEGEDAGEVA
ncbi:oligomeric complex COG6 [Dentipellis sp. KUC8613]|nr:oligomeric complex COG6 [Dentipellis sp. KUC8613]